MPRLCGACCSLMVFSAMIICGLTAGNSAEKILSRAIVGLFAGLILGALGGWVGEHIVRDNLETPEEPSPAADDPAPALSSSPNP